MWSAILTFIAAVVIIYLSYLVSKYVGKGMNRNGSSHYMRVLDQLMVGQDRYVAVIQAGDRYLLLGVTSQQINLLRELDAEDLIQLNSDTGRGSAKVPEFKELLSGLGGRIKRKGNDDV